MRPPRVSLGVELISLERVRQTQEEGYKAERDDLLHRNQGLALAAVCYALPAHFRESNSWYSRSQGWNKWGHPRWWPWSAQAWKPVPDDRIRELVKAGALIAAEIDRLARLKEM